MLAKYYLHLRFHEKWENFIQIFIYYDFKPRYLEKNNNNIWKQGSTVVTVVGAVIYAYQTQLSLNYRLFRMNM